MPKKNEFDCQFAQLRRSALLSDFCNEKIFYASLPLSEKQIMIEANVVYER